MILPKLAFRFGRKSRLALMGLILGSALVISTITLYNHAFFIAWKNLGNPVGLTQSGEKINTILGVSPRSIRVGTNYNRAFKANLTWIAWSASPIEYPLKWEEVAYERMEYTPANFGCPFSFWEPPLLAKLSGVIAEAQVKDCRLYVGIEQAHFVILEDGTVWVWEYQRRLDYE